MPLLLIGEFSYFSTIFANTQVKSPFLGQRSRHGLDFPGSKLPPFDSAKNCPNLGMLGFWMPLRNSYPPCNQQFEPENGMLEDVGRWTIPFGMAKFQWRTAVSFRVFFRTPQVWRIYEAKTPTLVHILFKALIFSGEAFVKLQGLV